LVRTLGDDESTKDGHRKGGGPDAPAWSYLKIKDYVNNKNAKIKKGSQIVISHDGSK